MQSAGRILLMPKGDYSASATYEMLDLVNHNDASWVCKKECTGQEPSDSNTEFWQRFGTAVDLSNYLPKSGGRLSKNKIIALEIENTAGNASVIDFYGADGRMGALGFNGKNIPIYQPSEGGAFNLLHTGNKPTGTYTGTGVLKNVAVGGIGKTVAIHSANGVSYISYEGAICKTSTGEDVTGVSQDVAYLNANNTLILNTDHPLLNANGVVYTYDLL